MLPFRRHLLVLALLSPVLMPGARAQSSLAVEVDGTLPGFQNTDLPLFVAVQMGRAGLPWDFAAARPGAAHAPNRVEWRFATAPGRGRLKGRTIVNAEIRLYRYTQFEKMTFAQTDIAGGPMDGEAAAFIMQATRDLLARTNPAGMR